MLIHRLSVLAAVVAPFDLVLAFVVLPIFLVSVVPISTAAWGVRASAMVMVLCYAGLMDSEGLIVSLPFGSPEFYGRHHRRSGSLGVWTTSAKPSPE